MRLAYLLLDEAAHIFEFAVNIAAGSIPRWGPTLFLIIPELLLFVFIIRMIFALLGCCIFGLLLGSSRRVLFSCSHILVILLLLYLNRLGDCSVPLRVQSIEKLLWCLSKFCDLYLKSCPLHRVAQLIEVNPTLIGYRMEDIVVFKRALLNAKNQINP